MARGCFTGSPQIAFYKGLFRGLRVVVRKKLSITREEYSNRLSRRKETPSQLLVFWEQVGNLRAHHLFAVFNQPSSFPAPSSLSPSAVTSILESRAPSLQLLQITSGLFQGKRELQWPPVSQPWALFLPSAVPGTFWCPNFGRLLGLLGPRLIICLSCMLVGCDFLGSTLSETAPLPTCPSKTCLEVFPPQWSSLFSSFWLNAFVIPLLVAVWGKGRVKGDSASCISYRLLNIKPPQNIVA